VPRWSGTDHLGREAGGLNLEDLVQRQYRNWSAFTSAPRWVMPNASTSDCFGSRSAAGSSHGFSGEAGPSELHLLPVESSEAGYSPRIASWAHPHR
jgi:hypothetical protein